jgi:hypothetical protein
VLDFHILHGPTNPRPLHVANGEVVLICISIGHDADRISEDNARIYLITSTEETPILGNIPLIDALRDLFLVHTRCSFSGLSVPDLSVKLRHRVSVS